jgi:hypothetical protein
MGIPIDFITRIIRNGQVVSNMGVFEPDFINHTLNCYQSGGIKFNRQGMVCN